MSAGPVYQTRHQHGWDTTSHDYHSHVTTIERTPSVSPDVPRYPNVFKAFNHKVVVEEDNQVINQGENFHKQQHPSKPQKKVQISEHEEIIEQDSGKGKLEVVKESIDVEADGFILQKHKGFELCKWKTFRL